MAELGQGDTKPTTRARGYKAFGAAGREERPFWSVMIPTYEPHQGFLETAVRSVLKQYTDPREMEIVLIDDCSPGFAPRAFLDSIGAHHVCCSRNETRLGLGANWNLCVEQGKGQWIHVMHQDDVVLPGFYESLKQGIEKEPQVGAAYCRDCIIDRDGSEVLKQTLEMPQDGILEDWLDVVFVRLRIKASAIVVKREVYRELGSFSLDYKYALDWDMWKRIAANYPVWYEPEVLVYYRRHRESATSAFLRNADDIKEIRRSIEDSRRYLPVDIADEVTRKARDNYTRYSIQLTGQLLRRGELVAAINHFREATKLTSFRTTLKSIWFYFHRAWTKAYATKMEIKHESQ